LKEKVLKVTQNQKPELKAVRESIHSSFESIRCCLMPHPGAAVATRKQYDGRWDKMEPEFKNELKKIIEHLLKPANLVRKKVNNVQLTCSELKEFIGNYFKGFNCTEIPPVLNIYESTVESNMNVLIVKCVDIYKGTFIKHKEMLTLKAVDTFHEQGRSDAMSFYESTQKMGSKKHAEDYRKKLSDILERTFKEWHALSFSNFKRLVEEKEKYEQAMEEKKRAEEDFKKANIEAQRRLANLEEQNRQQLIEQKQYEADRAKFEERLAIDQKKFAEMEAERFRDQQARENLEEELAAKGIPKDDPKLPKP